jgi:predicted Fe-Mo cluster-binding NifX family protein
MRIAIPVLARRLVTNFKDFEQITLLDTEQQEIKKKEHLTCPVSQPWMLPLWFQKHHVDLLIAGNMNEITIGLFQKAGIKVITGAPPLSPEKVIEKYFLSLLIMEERENIC